MPAQWPGSLNERFLRLLGLLAAGHVVDAHEYLQSDAGGKPLVARMREGLTEAAKRLAKEAASPGARLKERPVEAWELPWWPAEVRDNAIYQWAAMGGTEVEREGTAKSGDYLVRFTNGEWALLEPVAWRVRELSWEQVTGPGAISGGTGPLPDQAGVESARQGVGLCGNAGEGPVGPAEEGGAPTPRGGGAAESPPQPALVDWQNVGDPRHGQPPEDRTAASLRSWLISRGRREDELDGVEYHALRGMFASAYQIELDEREKVEREGRGSAEELEEFAAALTEVEERGTEGTILDRVPFPGDDSTAGDW